MTTELPIVNARRPCLVDTEYAHWFNTKRLIVDDIGVYYVRDGRKYYVCDQVMAIAMKDGSKEPFPDRRMLRRFIRTRCDPDVQAYWNS